MDQLSEAMKVKGNLSVCVEAQTSNSTNISQQKALT